MTRTGHDTRFDITAPIGGYTPPMPVAGISRAGPDGAPAGGSTHMTTEIVTQPWDQAERWARTIIALSGAGIAIWALLRWPVSVLLKAALFAAVRATLKDDEARASMVRVLREQLLATELARLGETAERVDALERERTRRRHGT